MCAWIISLNLKQFNTIMNLDFSDDQKYLQEEARKFFEYFFDHWFAWPQYLLIILIAWTYLG